MKLKSFQLICVFLLFAYFTSAQLDKIKLDPEKEKKFLPFLELRHGGKENFPKWKEENKYTYAKEMWYFSESFYIKRNHFAQGTVIDESMIDITRFESHRKETEEAIVTFPGMKDALVLLPANKLIFKP